jgi:hypothetical protein
MDKLIAVLLALAFSTVVTDAQKKEPPKWGSVSLEVAGAQLRLGMTKAEVIGKLAGSEITRIDEDNWIVAPKDALGPTLQFTNGQLNYADRYWPSQDNDIAESLFGAVNVLNSEGFSSCKVTSYTKPTPDATSQGVRIECGLKSVLLQRLTFGGKSYNTVYEQLGGMHPWTKN